MKKDKYTLGTIELNDSVYVSDPCYNVGIWCQSIISGLKPGKYVAYMNKADITNWGRRVTDLWIAHENNIKCWPSKLIKNADIGVDSGAAGIYDKEYFERYHIFEEDKYIDDYPESNDWYEKQFNLRYYYDVNGNKIEEKLHPDGYFYNEQERADGIVLDNKCAISFSGYGDGCYNIYAAYNSKNEVVGLRIKFI